MKALLTTAVAIGLICIAYVPQCSADDVSFTRRPNEMGLKISTVTSYRDRSAGGTSISCSGTCFAAGKTVEWKCHVPQNANVICQLNCSPPPAHGGCVEF